MIIGIFGCKNSSKFLIKSLIKKTKIDYLITINEAKGKKFNVADYCDLSSVGAKNNIDIYYSKTYSLKRKEDILHINSLKIDIAFVIGWQRIIPEKILDNLTIGAFGMHGSSMDLPLGRGRSPMNWSIIEDRKYFKTSLFRYDSGIDSGEVLDTIKFDITCRDTAETLHFKNTLSMNYLIDKNLKDLLSDNFKLRKQKNITPTYYPKREPSNSLIDWELDIYALERFIRAVTKPFNGAFTFLNNKVTIFNSQVFDSFYFGFENKSLGEIVAVFPNGKFLVKCNGGLLLVKKYFAINGDIQVGSIFYNNNLKVKKFQKNKFGNYDLEK
jgi:methionyl-tRNA formyltransferase